jgi:hypothetical protein
MAVVVFIIESAKIGIILEGQMECSLYCVGMAVFPKARGGVT